MKLIHIIDKDQNMWIDVDVFFQQSEMELNQWRSKISEQYKRDNNNPFFTCAWCQTPIILARRTDHMQINASVDICRLIDHFMRSILTAAIST